MIEYLIKHKNEVKAYQIVAAPNEFRYETEFFLRNGVYYAQDWNGEIVKMGHKSYL